MPLAYAICLLLGIFAIVAGFSRRSESARATPRPCIQTDTNAPSDRVVDIAENGSVTLDRMPCPVAELADRLSRVARTKAVPSVCIRADNDTSHAAVLAVLDQCRRAGVERVWMVPQPGDDATNHCIRPSSPLRP
jgi:biopolymer transport protein ExbD